jgi:hypothetical protein
MKRSFIMALLASSFDQSRFLRAEDVPQDRLLRIKASTEEMVGQGAAQEPKLVVWFTNDKRGLVLNRTNNRAIRGAYGDDVSGWKDKLIVVFQTQAQYRGGMVPALRVRIPPPRQQQADVVPQPNGPQPAAPTMVQPPAAVQPPTAAPTVTDRRDTFAPAAAKPESSFDLDDEIPFS